MCSVVVSLSWSLLASLWSSDDLCSVMLISSSSRPSSTVTLMAASSRGLCKRTTFSCRKSCSPLDFAFKPSPRPLLHSKSAGAALFAFFVPGLLLAGFFALAVETHGRGALLCVAVVILPLALLRAAKVCEQGAALRHFFRLSSHQSKIDCSHATWAKERVHCACS